MLIISGPIFTSGIIKCNNSSSCRYYEYNQKPRNSGPISQKIDINYLNHAKSNADELVRSHVKTALKKRTADHCKTTVIFRLRWRVNIINNSTYHRYSDNKDIEETHTVYCVLYFF